MPIRALVPALVACGLFFLAAPQVSAEPCAQGSSAVGGTLTAPAPCAKPSTRPLALPNSGQPRGEQPGTFRHGNTTIYMGGSISTQVGVGGRR
jgi:hypothetical protein